MFADMKRLMSLKLITSCMKLTLHSVFILRLGDNVRGKWRRREGCRQKNEESCEGYAEVNIKPACLSFAHMLHRKVAETKC